MKTRPCDPRWLFSCLFLPALVIGFLLPTGLTAQEGAIAGTVRDSASKTPLAAVLVEVVAGSGATVASGASGPSGAFRLAQIPTGTYSVRFTSPGWSTADVTGLTVSAGQTTSVTGQMVELSYNLNPITVTASKAEEKVLDAPAAVAVVSSLQIQEVPATTIARHVENKEGVDVIRTGVQSDYIVIRGFNNIFSGATLNLTDNRLARVPSLRANISHFMPTTSMDVDKIELVLGPGSALYGPNATNGVIHFITKSPIDDPGISLSFGGGIREQKQGLISCSSGATSDCTPASGDQVGVPSNNKGIWQAEGRIALAPSDKFGVKVSGQYFNGREYVYQDAEELRQQGLAEACIAAGSILDPNCLNFTNGLDLMDPDDIDLFESSVANVARGRRDSTSQKLERWTLDGRVDWRPNEETSLILGGGHTQSMSSIDLTGVGAGQVVDWAYDYAQARFLWRDLFAQVYWTGSSNDSTYLLRSGRPLVDKSDVFAAQLQHASRLGTQHRLVYGADYIRTIPKTDSTINGINELDDEIDEVGGYLQWEFAATPKLDLVGAARVDKSSALENAVFSPRAAVVFKPDPSNSLRLTFNRSFSTPSTLNLYLDISAQSAQVFGPFGYDVRAQGATKDGLAFLRDDNGVEMHMSPFNVLLGGTDRDMLPTTAPMLWAEGVAAMGAIQAGGGLPPELVGLCALLSGGGSCAQLLASLPAPGSADIAIDAATLDQLLAGELPSAFTGASDIARLKPTINNTLEVGYKGLLSNRVLLRVNAWYSHVQDYISALRVSTPNVFLNGQELGTYVATQLILGGAPATAAQAMGLAAAQVIGPIPLGVVTPPGVGGKQSTVALAYRNLGDFDLFGGEIGATFLVSDDWELEGSFSLINKDVFTAQQGVDSEEVPLNAPRVKGTALVRYRNDRIGLNGQARFRAQNGFPANSGVYIGDVEGYGVFGLNLGYKLPFFQQLWVQADVSNVFNTRYVTFVGTPEIGRLIMLRLRYDFTPF